MIDLFVKFKKDPSLKRHIAKTVSWRVVGTIDTMTLGWIVTGNPMSGVKIGGLEVFTKIILYFFHERLWYKTNFGVKKRRLKAMVDNVIRHPFKIDEEKRQVHKKHKSIVLWFCGLSGSGKSTIANALEEKLYDLKVHTFALDGDNTRLGINKDLDFTENGRKENIRRVSEIAKLFADSGIVVLSSFISPFEADRQMAREIVGEDRFFEIFVDTPLEVCEARDVKGLYKKAREGEIKNFTGIDSPFEAPKNPELHIHTDGKTIDESVAEILEVVKKRISLSEEGN